MTERKVLSMLEILTREEIESVICLCKSKLKEDCIREEAIKQLNSIIDKFLNLYPVYDSINLIK